MRGQDSEDRCLETEWEGGEDGVGGDFEAESTGVTSSKRSAERGEYGE